MINTNQVSEFPWERPSTHKQSLKVTFKTIRLHRITIITVQGTICGATLIFAIGKLLNSCIEEISFIL